MAVFTPCGCAGASVYVDATQFAHQALLSGSVDNPLRIKVAADKAVADGGKNLLKSTTSGFYVPADNQKLTAGNGIAVTGSGGTTPWVASVVLSPTGNAAKFDTQGRLLVPASDAVTVSPSVQDHALSLKADGLSAGSKHYSLATHTSSVRANTSAAWNLSAGAPVTSTTLILDVVNPSPARYMAVSWTEVLEMPYTDVGPSTALVVQLMDRSYLLGEAVPSYAPVDTAVFRNETGEPLTSVKYPALNFTASGLIPPSRTLRVQAYLQIDWSTGGSIGFQAPTDPNGALQLAHTTFTDVKSRIDIVGSTV